MVVIMEKDIVVDSCYIVGTCLLYKNSVDRNLLNRLQVQLSKYYEVDLSPEKITATVLEWRDFFRFNQSGEVILTKEGLLNKRLVRCLFSDALEPEISDRLLNAILNTKKEPINTKTKILKFPE